jgi:hypothetical protein
VTIYQDGPDLANQGTIVVSQAPLQPNYYTHSYQTVTQPSGPDYGLTRLAWYDDVSQGPNFQRSQAMPNAMMGRSRDGAYIPLKLTETCQDWQSQGNLICPFVPAELGTDTYSVWVRIPVVKVPAYPFPVVEPFYEPAGGGILGQSIPDLMNASVAHISARNLSDQTSFTFYFRMGIEVQLTASSSLTPQLKLSPPFDRVALDTYFAIARELKDGYPADYNDLGRMWDVISQAAKAVIPMLRYVPAIGPVAQSAVSLGDSIRSRRKNPVRRVPSKPSAQSRANAAVVAQAQKGALPQRQKRSRRPVPGQLSQAQIERALAGTKN